MIQWRDWQFVLAELLRANSHQHTLKSVASCTCVMASHTSADVTRFVVCNYYVASHKNVACTRETLHVRFAVRIAGNGHPQTQLNTRNLESETVAQQEETVNQPAEFSDSNHAHRHLFGAELQMIEPDEREIELPPPAVRIRRHQPSRYPARTRRPPDFYTGEYGTYSSKGGAV